MLGLYHKVPVTRSTEKSTTLVFVGLYFLLLAFFIYLNSISEPAEERIRSVIGSIDVAFKGEDQTRPEREQKEIKGDKLGLAVFHAQLKQVFEAAIPLVKAETNEQGEQLQFTIPVSQLFPDGAVKFRENRIELFQNTARALIKRSSVEPTDMEILIDVGDALPAATDIRHSLPAKRLNRMVTYFMDQGVPARNIFVGLMQEGTGYIYFKFYIRQKFNKQFRKESVQ